MDDTAYRALAVVANHTIHGGQDVVALRPLAGTNKSFREQIVAAWADKLFRESSIDGEPSECFAACRAMRLAVRLRVDLGVMRALHAMLKATGQQDERKSLVEYASILCSEDRMGDRSDVVGDMVEAIWGDVEAAKHMRNCALAWCLHRAASGRGNTVRMSLVAFLRSERTPRDVQRLWRRINHRGGAAPIRMTVDQLHRATEFFELRRVFVDGTNNTKALAIQCSTGYSTGTRRCNIYVCNTV